ncbi:MAG TPA: family 20 glycosylhydrolase [Candidatus Sulfotelmatobacter sp.]|nr:family 20 glycosylhydrolase [Candidatus Sulfotelmatobacter sp.]
MPMPSSLQMGTGALPIAGSFSVVLDGYKEPRVDRAVQRFVRDLSQETGMPLRYEAVNPANATLVVHADYPSKPIQEVSEDESYVLDVSTSGAKLTAPNALGIMHGLQTFLQLVEITPTGFVAPAVHIEDSPRFPWRGLCMDVSRHFISQEVLKRNIDGMAAVKMNVLHLHISDDQGFRVESKEFPKLQQMGSDGRYYTQVEIRDLIGYASDRGIRVVPEFDMPGHATAWFVGYPELSSGPGPYQIERRWGIFDPAMDPSRESTYKFLDKFIGEMAELFPDAYFHIGGDEVNGKQWDGNKKIQDFMRANKLKTDQDLQQYFTLRVEKIVSKHHKIMVGWDEILGPNMPKTIVIQSWRGQDSLAAAAKQGYSGILSSGYYLDAMAPAQQYYSVDPMANADATLTPEEQKRILGGEACMWVEFVTDENIDSRIWPRAAAIAERLWSAQQLQDVGSMYLRLEAVSQRLELLELRHRSNLGQMFSRMAGTEDIAALRVLADAVEPVSLQIREEDAEKAGGIQTNDTPLNRMVDAIAPESEVGRRFSELVNQFVASNFQDDQVKAEIRALLVSWRDNDNRLRPLLQNSYLLKELSPVSQSLTLLGGAGLQAVDYIEKDERAPDSWRNEQIAVIQQAQKPAADLVLAVAPAVQKLVEAAAGTGAKK